MQGLRRLQIRVYPEAAVSRTNAILTRVGECNDAASKVTVASPHGPGGCCPRAGGGTAFGSTQSLEGWGSLRPLFAAANSYTKRFRLAVGFSLNGSSGRDCGMSQTWLWVGLPSAFASRS